MSAVNTEKYVDKNIYTPCFFCTIDLKKNAKKAWTLKGYTVKERIFQKKLQKKQKCKKEAAKKAGGVSTLFWWNFFRFVSKKAFYKKKQFFRHNTMTLVYVLWMHWNPQTFHFVQKLEKKWNLGLEKVSRVRGRV